MACRTPQAPYPVYNILISGVNISNNYGYRPNVRSTYMTLSRPSTKIEGPPGNTRVGATQTIYRESETQTEPFEPEIKKPFNDGLQVLTLSWLSWNNGLPVGMREVAVIERARQRRAWESALPNAFNATTIRIYNMILEAIDLNEWNNREVELAALSSIRMELARKCMRENLAGNKIKYRNIILRYVSSKSGEKQAALHKVRLELKRNIRKLTYVHRNTNRHYFRWNIVQELGDKTSEMYGPQQRFGVDPRRAHEHIPKEFRYVNVFSSSDILTDIVNLSENTTSFDYVNNSKPQRSYKKLCMRETNWTTHELEKLCNEMRLFRQYENKHSKRQSSMRQRLERIRLPKDISGVAKIPDEDDNDYLSAITLQKIIKGRAIQAVMFEGRVRCQHLIEEVKSTHALQLHLDNLEHEKERKVYLVQRKAELKANEEKRKNEILVSLEGKTVADILDFLSKELIRLQNERETHELALMAVKVRNRKEAAEAGRRQKEEERSREHVEMWKQICKTYQNSLDTVTEELVGSLRRRFSTEQARREATEYAKKIDRAAMEAQIRGVQLEEEEIVADLVYNFALPEAEKEIVRSRLKMKQKSLLSTCHDMIYSNMETVVKGSRSHTGRLSSIPRPVQKQQKDKDYVTYAFLNRAGTSTSSSAETFKSINAPSATAFLGQK